MKKITLDGNYQTRDGDLVEILSVNGDSERYPVIYEVVGNANIYTTTSRGVFDVVYKGESLLDLIEAPDEDVEARIAELYKAESKIREQFRLDKISLKLHFKQCMAVILEERTHLEEG